jgi:predicted MFS family arabinose efflux permease
MKPQPKTTRPQSAFRHKPFRIYFAAGIISYMGMWFEKVALGWFTWELTQSAFWTGFVAVALTAPTGLFGPLIGVLAEGWDHRRASIILNILLGTASIGLWALSNVNGVTVVPVAVLAVVIGILSALYHPVRLVLVSQVVPRNFLVSAVGLQAMAYNSSRVVGPALAGVVIATAGTGSAFLVNASTYVPLAIVLVSLPLIDRQRSKSAGESLAAQLVAGFRYARTQQMIWWCLTITVISSVFGRGVVEIMPAIVGGLLAGNAGDLAFFISMAGAGAVGSSVLYTALSPSLERIGLWCAIGLPINMLAIASIGLVPDRPVLAALFVLTGFCTTLIGIGTQTIIQISVAEDFRARVLTWWSSANFGGVTIGAMVLGAAGDVLPLGAVLIAAGLGSSGLALWAALSRRT